MRNASGNISINDKLTSFMYELLRDHLPASIVEELVRSSEEEIEVSYSNGWLAQYADCLSKRLK